MYPPQAPAYHRSTSPPRHGNTGPPPPMAGIPDAMLHRTVEKEINEKNRLAEELKHKEGVLKQLEIQFELYKEEHAKLLASKLEEQREVFNLEKDRINQHFIKTGQELHGKTEDLNRHSQEALKMQKENALLKEWLDRGVEECRRVAEENERIKTELWEAKSALSKNDTTITSKLTSLELERDRERSEKEAAQTALQSLQEKVREMEVGSDEDRRNFAEITIQSRRMRKRMGQLKQLLDRYAGDHPHDPLSVLDEVDSAEDLDLHSNTPAGERQTARDSLFHAHEALNNLQASCKRLLQEGVGMGSLEVSMIGDLSQGLPAKQRAEQLAQELEIVQSKLRRKQEEMDEMEKEKELMREKNTEFRNELEEELSNCRRQKNQATMDFDNATNEANRLRGELEQTRIMLNRLSEQDEIARRRASDLEEDLRKLTQEMTQIRDYGVQLEQQNEDLKRKLNNTGTDSQEMIDKLQQQLAETQQELSQVKQLQQHQPQTLPSQATPTVQAVAPSVVFSTSGNQQQPQNPIPPPTSTPGVHQPPAPTPNLRMMWPTEPEDYGHASPAHPKLSCPLCSTQGFVPGLPCRNCGHSVGQFTKLRDLGTPQYPQQPVHSTPAQHLQQQTSQLSPARWH